MNKREQLIVNLKRGCCGQTETQVALAELMEAHDATIAAASKSQDHPAISEHETDVDEEPFVDMMAVQKRAIDDEKPKEQEIKEHPPETAEESGRISIKEAEAMKEQEPSSEEMDRNAALASLDFIVIHNLPGNGTAAHAARVLRAQVATIAEWVNKWESENGENRKLRLRIGELTEAAQRLEQAKERIAKLEQQRGVGLAAQVLILSSQETGHFSPAAASRITGLPMLTNSRDHLEALKRLASAPEPEPLTREKVNKVCLRILKYPNGDCPIESVIRDVLAILDPCWVDQGERKEEKK